MSKNLPTSLPRRRTLLRWVAVLAVSAAGVLGTGGAGGVAYADGVELVQLSSKRNDDGLDLSFNTHFDLSSSAENALQNGVAIYFTAEATLLRHRWYWRDARVAKVSRTWRLVWQKAFGLYKISTGGLTQSFSSLSEAMALLRGQTDWHLADAKDLDNDGGYYLEFSYKLDTSQLPPPMLIGLGTPHGWDLSIERSVMLNPDFSIHTTTP